MIGFVDDRWNVVHGIVKWPGGYMTACDRSVLPSRVLTEGLMLTCVRCLGARQALLEAWPTARG